MPGKFCRLSKSFKAKWNEVKKKNRSRALIFSFYYFGMNWQKKSGAYECGWQIINLSYFAIIEFLSTTLSGIT